MNIIQIERVKAGDSTVNQCPQCKGVALRQIGDPRLHREMGIEFRRRACLNNGCGWIGVEVRAIISPAIASVIEEAMIEQKLMEDAG